ncbi:MAG: alcohol dehydrogenase catalytic domain-containing protein [Candidatus Bathyarchaeota archaeon]|nr:alcohol dehydrogenase catalytic domain-containing protein [Candidatus Bathyarchaeota archaeon]
MLAAVFEGNGKLVLKDRPVPSIKRENDVLVKVTGVGICGTDLHILQVPPAHPAKIGSILGHEFTGTIAEVGNAVKDFKSGDMVLVDPHPGCGLCTECRNGRPDRCIPLYAGEVPGQCKTIGIFSDGAMTSYVIVPKHALFKVSSKVPSYLAALAEPLSCVVSASNKLKVQPGEDVVILGAGPIGLLFTCLFKACGAAKIIVSEPSDYRRKVAIECGATLIVDPKKENLEKIVLKETGDGADVVVEAVGMLLNQTLNLVRAGGKVLQFGHDELAKPAIQVAEIVRKEITIYGAFIGKFSFEKVAKIIESGVLPLEKVVSHRLPLSEVHKGIDLLKKQAGLKIILHPED